MRRLLLLAVCAAVAAGCESIQSRPDPRGALGPNQRLVVDVYPSPGPWIIGAADSKAEAAAKLSPLGFFVQTAENEHTLSVSKNLQQYLPRPRLGLAVQDSLLKALRNLRPAGSVQTGTEAGISTAQLAQWNKSKDQLDWRQRYYSPDPDQPQPRDYAKILTLDDALILDVNVSFGTDATEDGKLLPTMSAASRVYRGDTAHLVWEHEDIVSDQTSSATMTDIQVTPSILTESLKTLAPALGTTIAGSFLKSFGLIASTSAAKVAATGGGLVPMSFFQNLSTSTAVSTSTAAPAGVASSTAAPAGVFSSTAAAAGMAPSSSTAAGFAPPPATSSTTAPAAAPAATAMPGMAPPAPSPPPSTPAVSVSTSP